MGIGVDHFWNYNASERFENEAGERTTENEDEKNKVNSSQIWVVPSGSEANRVLICWEMQQKTVCLISSMVQFMSENVYIATVSLKVGAKFIPRKIYSKSKIKLREQCTVGQKLCPESISPPFLANRRALLWSICPVVATKTQFSQSERLQPNVEGGKNLDPNKTNCP